MVFDAKYNHSLPHQHVNELVSSMLNLFQKFRNSNDAADDQLMKIERIVKSEHLQKVFKSRTLKNHIEPQVVDLLDETGNVVTCYTYVPIKDICTKYLTNASLVNHLIEEGAKAKRQMSHSQTFGHFMDGSAFKARQLYGKLKLELYLDDANMSPTNLNNKQKTLFVYLTAADLPIYHRSKKLEIETIIVANRFKLKNLGENAVAQMFNRLKDDLAQLTKAGIQVKHQGETKTIGVELAMVIGDNLQINELLGYKQNFNNNSYVCRYCSASFSDLDDANRDFLLLEELQSGQSKKKDKKDYGIMRDFAFDGLSNITRLNLCPPDPTHDIAEGTLSVFLTKILHSLTLWERVSQETILQRITEYGPKLAEGQPIVKAASVLTYSITGTASQVCYQTRLSNRTIFLVLFTEIRIVSSPAGYSF